MKLKCECYKASKGAPLFKYGGRKYCAICMFFYLRDEGYIDENDVKFIGNIGEVEDEN